MKEFFSKIKPRNFFNSALLLTALVSFWGAAVYRFYSLNNFGLIISLILAIITFIILQYFQQKNNGSRRNAPVLSRGVSTDGRIKIFNYLLPTAYLLLAAVGFWFLYRGQTSQSIVSPWETVSPLFFLFYFLASAVLLSLGLRRAKFFLPLLSLHFFLSFSVLWLVYKIGYGFDPFIHRATLDLIERQGAVLPKPFYYLGQYSLEIIFHKLSGLSLVWLDKLLVPLLSALFLPGALYRLSRKYFGQNQAALIMLPLVLILPFSFLTFTVPQNLAYLFLLLALFLTLTAETLPGLILPGSLALAALFTHPLAGLPAILFVCLCAIHLSDKIKRKKIWYGLIFVLAALLLPLLFYFVNHQSAAPDLAAVAPESFSGLTVPGRENFILNFVYLYGFNLKIIVALLVAGGLFIAYRRRQIYRPFFHPFFLALALLPAYLITKFLPFSFLINYERGDYAQRILLALLFFLSPFILTALYFLTDKILKQTRIIKFSWLFILISCLTASLYLSYPRLDRYFNSRGYAVGATDLAAVNWISETAKNDYIVLSNQQVAAAALSRFGFARYYQDNIFYYPIPTGGPLYQYYLEMVYEKPSRTTMKKAMDLAGVREGYLVLNKYWWNFPRVLDEAKLAADSFNEFGDGQVYVLKYENESSLIKN